MKKPIKIISGTIAFILIFTIICFANATLGNPISKMIATKSAKEYISENYSELDIELGETFYNFKDGYYHTYIKSPTSIDTHFSVAISPFGKISYDSYESNVKDKWNTYDRLNRQYNDKIERIIGKVDFKYKSDINFGNLMDEEVLKHEDYGDISYGMDIKNLEIDKNYDLYKLGKEYGNIVFHVQSDEVSIKTVSEILLYIKKIFDENNTSFYAIEFILDKPRAEDKGVDLNEESINIKQILYKDIYEDGLEDRVDKEMKRTNEYYKKLDEVKLEQDKPSEENIN